MKTNATVEQMEKALKQTNLGFDGNVQFNNFTKKGNFIIFTLRVKSSKGAGAARSWSGRRSVAACWHVHGTFIQNLININHEARVYSSRTGWIDRNGGNWQDFNVGSIMRPAMASECCDCN